MEERDASADVDLYECIRQDLPDLNLRLSSIEVLDQRLVLLD
jgi:hypothetical protein